MLGDPIRTQIQSPPRARCANCNARSDMLNSDKVPPNMVYYGCGSSWHRRAEGQPWGFLDRCDHSVYGGWTAPRLRITRHRERT